MVAEAVSRQILYISAQTNMAVLSAELPHPDILQIKTLPRLSSLSAKAQVSKSVKKAIEKQILSYRG